VSEPTPWVPREYRLALGVAYAGAAVTALGALGVGVLLGQARLARWVIPKAEAPPPRCNGTYGRHYSGPPLHLAVLGDSTAAGYGVATAAQTPGALLATWIADAARRPVRVTCPAAVGAQSSWLAAQVENVLEEGPPDLATIFVGANDVTAQVGREVAVEHLADAVRTLRAHGAEVVAATCPDLGTIRPIQPPLRWLARRWSRQLAQAQTVAVIRAGGRTVSLGDLLGPQFAAQPELLFGADRFHPSVEGYEAAAAAVLPAALTALGLGSPAESADTTLRPLNDAAADAVAKPGTEVSPVPTAAGAAGTARTTGSSARKARSPRSASPRDHAELEAR